MSPSRREFLRNSALAAGGAFLVPNALRQALASGAPRASRLFPGPVLAMADLHNHSFLSDADGDPAFFYARMRAAGLDIAALTDHSGTSWGPVGDADPCGKVDGAYSEAEGAGDCRSVGGINEENWRDAAVFADAANEDGEFTAIRGFEWSSPFLGHMNVWGSERWIDPLNTGGGGIDGLGEHADQIPGAGPHLRAALDTVLRQNPAKGAGMLPFYEWLAQDPDSPLVGGGSDAIAGFNHPGREFGRFGYFRHDARIAPRIVSLEMFNRRDDYIFASYAAGQPSPLVECLNAGWRVGLLGVTDEHGRDWGSQVGKGRAGLYVHALSRAGMREAMLARRFFATRETGLRLDASANGVRMGQTVPHTSGDVTFAIDLEGMPLGKALEVQVLRPDTAYPLVVHVEPFTVGGVFSFTVPLDRADGDWVVLRIADPAGVNNEKGPTGHPCNNRGVAYASPFWLG